MKTAMQDLREDLQHTIDSANDALMEIENVIIRKACQKAVELTLKNVVKRIDDELLETEKQQIIDAIDDGVHYSSPEAYYNETFKND